MPTPFGLIFRAGRRMTWMQVFWAAKWLYERGRENLTEAERRELGVVLRKSKGDPRKLTVSERERIRALVVQGVKGGHAE